MSLVEQPNLSDYPLIASKDKIEVLDAYTVYKFLDDNKKTGRWLAVLTVKSKFKTNTGADGTAVSVRIYRWEYREVTRYDRDTNTRIGTGTYKWMEEQTHTINREDIWKKTKGAIDEFLQKYIE